MKSIVVLVVALTLCGVVLGGYMLVRQPAAASRAAASNPGGSRTAAASEPGGLTTGEVLELREEIGVLAERYEQRIETLEAEVGQQAQEIDRLKKQLAAERPATPSAAGGEESAPESSPGEKLSVADADRETLKELLGELSEERRRDEFQQREDRMREELALARQRQIDSLAEKYKWDEQKKQQVLGVLSQQAQKLDEMRKSARADGTSSEAREQLQAQIQALREDTQKTLEELLTEEEYQELQKAARPARRDRAAGRRSRLPSGRQPGAGGQ
jgi:chromosome segregation ATPase